MKKTLKLSYILQVSPTLEFTVVYLENLYQFFPSTPTKTRHRRLRGANVSKPPLQRVATAPLVSINVGTVRVNPVKVASCVQPVLSSRVRIRPQLKPPGHTVRVRVETDGDAGQDLSKLCEHTHTPGCPLLLFLGALPACCSLLFLQTLLFVTRRIC